MRWGLQRGGGTAERRARGAGGGHGKEKRGLARWCEEEAEGIGTRVQRGRKLARGHGEEAEGERGDGRRTNGRGGVPGGWRRWGNGCGGSSPGSRCVCVADRNERGRL